MGVKGEKTRAILLALLQAKQGAGGPLHFLETIAKKRLWRSLPEQNPGLRKIVGIRERKCRVKRERVSHEHYFMQRRA